MVALLTPSARLKPMEFNAIKTAGQSGAAIVQPSWELQPSDWIALAGEQSTDLFSALSVSFLAQQLYPVSTRIRCGGMH